MQNDILTDLENNDNQFWKTIGKTGIDSYRKKCIPMQIVLDDGSLSNDVKLVLNKWKTDFSSLLNSNSSTDLNDVNNSNLRTNSVNNVDLDADISIFEVVKAVKKG